MAALALPSGQANAAKPKFFKCDEAPGGRCGTLKVPLDRMGTSDKKIKIFFEYYKPRDGKPSDEAVVMSGGGPGFSATQDPFYSDFLRDAVFKPALKTRHFIVLDQRGVGRSGALNCPELQHPAASADAYGLVGDCGEALGRRSQLYGSGDVALDLEALRQALDIDQLNLFGASYAGIDLQAYVTRFPERVRAAVLDGPASVPGFDPFYPEMVNAHDRASDLICERSLSCGPELDMTERLAWLADRLRTDPVEGTAMDENGKERDVVIDETFMVWNLMFRSEGGFVSLSEIGAAATALENGDELPLLRLAAEHHGDFGLADEGPPRVFSMAHNFARYCTDFAAEFLWDTSGDLAARTAQFEAARDALPDDFFAPYSVEGWLVPMPRGFLGPDMCISWPASDGPVEPLLPPGYAFPADVPALILTGDLDLDTPTAEAEVLEAEWPNSQLIEVANAEHTPAVTARFECVTGLIQRFLKNLDPGDTSCAEDLSDTSFPAVGRFPATSDDADPATVRNAAVDESTEADRKVVAAAAAATTDGFRRVFLQNRPREGVGLRGGTFEVDFVPGAADVRLRNARFAEDVAVKGSVGYLFGPQKIKGEVEVKGPGDQDGSITINGVWFAFGPPATTLKITGEIDGRELSLAVPAS